MNNLRRKLLKFSIIQFFTLFISTKSFAQNIVFKKIKSYKKKSSMVLYGILMKEINDNRKP